MGITRIISALLGFPVVAVILIWGNQYLIDITFSVIAIFCIHEYSKSFQEEKNPAQWVGYVAAASISLIHIIPRQYSLLTLGFSIPVLVLVLFCQAIATNLKIKIRDISLTVFGVCYIVVFIMFLPILCAKENGNLLIWYVFLIAWGTDTFAYMVGKLFGKHKIKDNTISPNKTIEGCIAGLIGSILTAVVYTVFLNYYSTVSISYLYIILVTIALSLIGQIGDFAASSIKRENGIKDFSNLIPGHGGMLDRFDSVIFIAPFAYFLLLFI